ncbi:MAG TPA: helix-turn-helix transcriptional regulator [Polyangiaceae bacterium]|nr:helix-turn-helix transcriptional regulator [Polyangiaceae bacterium]
MHSRPHDPGNPAGGFHSSRTAEPRRIERIASGTFLAQNPNAGAAAEAESQQDTLRFLAFHADANGARTVDVSLLWTELVTARVRIVDSFYSDTSNYIALLATPEGTGRDRRLSRRKLDVIERVLLRGGQKPVAAELGLAPSTVAIIAGNCLRAMGFDLGASRVPLPITLSIHAVHGLTELREARLSEVTLEGRSYSILSTPRPEYALESTLSKAEYAVTRLLVEGQSHAEIAARRQTSVRTVANQLAAAFHKLGVSGRCELVCQLVASRPRALELRSAEPEPEQLPEPELQPEPEPEPDVSRIATR